METTQTKVLKALKTNGRISSTKDTPEEESAVIDKLKAFGIIENHTTNSFKPTKLFYQYSEALIESQTPVEQFQLKEEKASHNIYNTTINTESIGQFGQGSGVFHFDQISIEGILKTLEQELSSEQLKELEEIINRRDGNQLITRLKSFGSDVLAKVVSGILTTPGIYS